MESKEIKAYDRLFDSLMEGSILTDDEKLRYNEIVSNALTEKQELEKFARLVISKEIPINILRDVKSVEAYNELFTRLELKNRLLTQAEFDFVKSMVKRYE